MDEDELPDDTDSEGLYDDPGMGFDVAQAPPKMDPVAEFGEIMKNIRVPMEVKRRIQPLLEAQVMQQAAYDQGLQQMQQRQTGLRNKATSTKEGFYAEIDKPLPIDAAKMALNKATGYFAQALSPKGNFVQKAEERRTEEIGEIKARRLQRLRGMETEALNAAKRADEMDDVMEKEKAFREAEKLQQQIGTLAGGLKEYNQLQDKKEIIVEQSKARQDQIRATWHGRALTTAGKLDPLVAAQLKLLTDRNTKELRGIDDQLSELKNNFDMNGEQREKARGDLLNQRQQLIEGYMDEANQLLGTQPAEVPQAAPKAIPREAVVHDIVSNFGDKSPAQLQKILDKDPASLAEDFNLDPADKAGITAAKDEVMTLARKGHKLRNDIQAEVKAIIFTREQLGSDTVVTAGIQARLNNIRNLNIKLTALGLPPVPGTPGAEDYDNPRMGREAAGETARGQRGQAFKVPLN